MTDETEQQVNIEQQVERERVEIDSLVDNMEIPQGYECVIEGDLTPEQIRKFVSYPGGIEMVLTEENGQLIFNRGEKDEVDHQGPLYHRITNSRLFFHTHNEHYEGGVVAGPSFSDLYLIGRDVSENTNILIAHKKGITQLRPPDPDLPEFRDCDLRFLHKKGLTFLNPKYDKGYQRLSEVDPQTQAEMARELAEEMDMIVADIPWEDEAGIVEMMDIINLRS